MEYRNCCQMHYHISFTEIKYLRFISQLFLLSCSLCFLLIGLQIGVSAEAPTTVYLDQCELTADVHLTYLYSDNDYTVINNLNNTDQIIYFSAESEKCVLWDSDSNYGISNASASTLNGFLSLGYKIKIDYADTIAVYQPHYYTSYNQSTRDAWAYYRASVNDIDTDLLYRSERSNTVVNLLIVGIILLIISAIFKMLRRER